MSLSESLSQYKRFDNKMIALVKIAEEAQKTIYHEEMRAYEFEQIISEIKPKEHSPILLNEGIILNIKFDSNNGFTLSIPEFNVEYVDIEFHRSSNNIFESRPDPKLS